MKQRKIPLRKCLITNQQFFKHELTRVVINKDNEVKVDVSGKLNGRGAYLKLSRENVALAKERRVLEREFKVDNIENIYDELMELCDE